MDLYCEDAECDRPQDGHGRFCSRCLKRRQRGADTSAPFAEKLSPLERALVLADQLSNCDSADDREYARLERALKIACRSLGREERRQAIRAGLARRRALGLPVGGVPKLDCVTAAQAVEKAGGNISQAARLASVSRNALKRAMQRCGLGTKTTDRNADSPRPDGD